jgi:RNA polymerase sigma-70 factor (ECF subfamily)
VELTVSELPRRARAAEPEESDALALQRIAQGDLSALGVVYDRHHVAVLRFLERVLANHSEAEDVAQETFLTACRIAHNFDGRASCRPWLFGIASRLMLHRGRGKARLARFLVRLAAHDPEPHGSPHDVVIRSEQQQALSDALTKLSQDKRIVLILSEVEDLTAEEVARSLGIPQGTVWTRLHHARRQLRKHLERGQR